MRRGKGVAAAFAVPSLFTFPQQTGEQVVIVIKDLLMLFFLTLDVLVITCQVISVSYMKRRR